MVVLNRTEFFQRLKHIGYILDKRFLLLLRAYLITIEILQMSVEITLFDMRLIHCISCV